MILLIKQDVHNMIGNHKQQLSGGCNNYLMIFVKILIFVHSKSIAQQPEATASIPRVNIAE